MFCLVSAILLSVINLRKVAKKLTLFLVFFIKKGSFVLFILLKENSKPFCRPLFFNKSLIFIH
jgi:hypothetical protein